MSDSNKQVNGDEAHGELTPLVGGHAVRVKRGHKCCGCCCDSRRAVIVVDLIDAVINLCGFALVIYGSRVVSQEEEQERSYFPDPVFDDDEMKSLFPDVDTEEEEKQFFQLLPVVLTVSVLKVLLDLAGVFGALKFKAPFVMTALVRYALQFVAVCFFVGDIGVSMTIESLLYTGLFAYPHVFFLREAQQNIMTQENYYNEAMCCCCV